MNGFVDRVLIYVEIFSCFGLFKVYCIIFQGYVLFYIIFLVYVIIIIVRGKIVNMYGVRYLFFVVIDLMYEYKKEIINIRVV